MFSASKAPAASKMSKNPPQKSAVTILTSGCHFTGKLFCRGSSRIGGKIEGQIVSEGLLIIEEEAVIMAEIKADEVIIQGQVKGKLIATSRVELCDTSEFEGDISAQVLIVREGAQFNGRSTMMPKDSNKTGAKILQTGKPVTPSKAPIPDIANDIKQDVSKLKGPDVNVRSS